LDKQKYQQKIEASLVEEILFSFKRGKIYVKINEALRQHAKIIILDVTSSSLGYAFSYYSSSNKRRYPIQTALNNSIELLNSKSKDYIPIIIFVQAIDHDCNLILSSAMIPCPIKNTKNRSEVDLSKFPNEDR
jgi:hypothetical protein